MSDQALHPASRKITHTLFATQSLFGASQIAVFTVVPILSAQLAGSESLAGVPMTITFLARSLCAYPFGWIMDNWGRRAGLSLGYIAAMISAVICIAAIDAGSFIGFCVGALFSGMGRSAGEQARYVAAEVYPPQARARVIGRIVFAGTVSAIGGPLLVAPSGQWVSQFGLNPLAGSFTIGIVACALAAVLTAILLKPDPLTIAQTYKTDIERADNTPSRAVSQILRDPRVRYAIWAQVAGQFVMTLLMVITPLHMSHHHSTEVISLVIMSHALGMFGLSGMTGHLVSRFGQNTVIRIGGVILIASCVIAPVSPEFVPLAVALFLLGLGWNLCFIAGSSLLANALEPHERGRIQGVSEALVSLAAGVASLMTGVLFDLGGMVLLGGIGLVVALFLGGYSFFYKQEASTEP